MPSCRQAREQERRDRGSSDEEKAPAKPVEKKDEKKGFFSKGLGFAGKLLGKAGERKLTQEEEEEEQEKEWEAEEQRKKDIVKDKMKERHEERQKRVVEARERVVAEQCAAKAAAEKEKEKTEAPKKAPAPQGVSSGDDERGGADDSKGPRLSAKELLAQRKKGMQIT